VVALVDAGSPVERELIGGWLAEGGIDAEFGVDAPVTQLDLDAEAVALRLVGRRDDPLVVPIRVLWLPAERDGVRRMTFADLAKYFETHYLKEAERSEVLQRLFTNSQGDSP